MEEFVLGLEGRLFKPGQYQINSIKTGGDFVKFVEMEITAPQFMSRCPVNIELSYGPLVGEIHRLSCLVLDYQVYEDGNTKLKLRSSADVLQDWHIGPDEFSWWYCQV